MKIAITGASGFLGKSLIKALINSNHEIRALSRKQKNSENLQVVWYQGDINDKASLVGFLKGCSVVCNCAGEIVNPANFESTNILGVKVLHQASVEAGAELFIQISSAGIYSEPADGKIDEMSKVLPCNAYEDSKIKAEEILFSSVGIKTVILRPTTIYADDMPNESLKGLFSAIVSKRFFFIGSRKSISCYISLDNVVSAIATVIDSGEKISVVDECVAYNISDDMYYIDFLNLLATELNVTLPSIRVPRFLILTFLWLNEGFLRIRLPLTSSRAKALSRRSSFVSNKFHDTFDWSPPVTHSETIRQCVQAWFPKKRT